MATLPEKDTCTWRIRDARIAVTKPIIMGIVNVTPDSFYDGGEHSACDAACMHAVKLCSEGADILDIGGESTRPGAEPVSIDEEIQRVCPVIEKVSHLCDAYISVDTRHAEVAEKAIEAGAHIINDVSGMRDQMMRKTAAQSSAGVVVMHMHGTPADMQKNPLDPSHVIPELQRFFTEQIALMLSDGIAENAIVLDPGIGFGKTFEANEYILQNIEELEIFSRPLCIGASRKRFIGERTQKDSPADRLYGSLAAHVIAYMNGARIIRTHDVAVTRDALAVADAIQKSHIYMENNHVA